MNDDPPVSASTIIIGAGAIGASIARELALRGERDILVLEKSGVTHGSTWHAAGLVGQYRSREDLTRLMRRSVETFDDIQSRTPIDWKRVGSLRLASSAARWREFLEAKPLADRYGVEFNLVDAAEAKRLFPLLDVTGVHGAVFIPGDGYVDPTSLTMAYMAEAKRLGARLREGVTVTGILREGRRVRGVITDRGEIRCEKLVIAAGVWARPVAAMAGIDTPVAALSHQYAVTEKRADIAPGLPALRDPDRDLYVKPEPGAFAIGGWEANTVAATTGDMPFSFGQELLPDDFDRLAPILEAAAERLPILNETGVRTIINGPIPVTPDGEPILGPAPGCDNVFLAVGFTSGIAASGGAGWLLAGWMLDGAPEFPLPSLDPRRFDPAPILLPELNRCAIAAYGGYYKLAGAGRMDRPVARMSS